MVWLNAILQHSSDYVHSSDYINNFDIIGLFFSAKWCPPCVEFEEIFASCFKIISDEKSFGVIAVTDDKDEDQYGEHVSKFSWPSIKFSDFRLRKQLKHRFHVTGLPKLVIIDGVSGKILNNDAKANVENDPEGVNFPWPEPSVTELLKGPVTLKGQPQDLEACLKEKSILGLYFSADWCPPCRQFTPTLANIHDGLKENGFEVLYCGMDKVEEKFTSSVQTMSWLCFPWKDNRVRLLAKALQVEDIPQLVIWDLKKNEVINRNAITRIRHDPTGDKFPWKPELVTVLTMGNISEMSNEVVFLFILPTFNDMQVMLADLSLIANRFKEFRFYAASDEDVVVARLRDILQVGDQCPYLLFLDFESKTWARCENRMPGIQDVEPFVEAVMAEETQLVDFPASG